MNDNNTEPLFNCSDYGINYGFRCVCFSGYEGEFCEIKVMWWRPMYLGHRILCTIFMAFCIYWALLILARQIHFKIVNLVTGINLANLTACILRVIWVWIPNEIVAGDDYSLKPTWVTTLIFLLPNTIWVGAFTLMLGFWNDLLHAKASTSKTVLLTRTKIICIVSSVVLLVLEFIILSTLLDSLIAVIVGFVLLLVYLAILSVTIIISLRLIPKIMKLVEASTQGRIARLSKFLIIGMVGFIFWAFTVIGYVFSGDASAGSATLNYLHRILEFLFSAMLCITIDNKYLFCRPYLVLLNKKDKNTKKTVVNIDT